MEGTGERGSREEEWRDGEVAVRGRAEPRGEAETRWVYEMPIRAEARRETLSGREQYFAQRPQSKE